MDFSFIPLFWSSMTIKILTFLRNIESFLLKEIRDVVSLLASDLNCMLFESKSKQACQKVKSEKITTDSTTDWQTKWMNDWLTDWQIDWLRGRTSTRSQDCLRFSFPGCACTEFKLLQVLFVKLRVKPGFHMIVRSAPFVSDRTEFYPDDRGRLREHFVTY